LILFEKNKNIEYIYDIYLYNILGWSSFPSIRPILHPSKFLIPEEEDDGTGGGRRLMVAAAVYPRVHVILLPQFV
jgi:hypothetical protein